MTTAALAVVAVAGAVAAARAATPAEDLDRARAAFRQGDYATAIPLLTYLLYPSPRLAGADDLLEAHVLLGVCAFETGDRTTASREFEEALYQQPELALDTVLFSAAAVQFFDAQKARLAERAAADAERRQIAEDNERYKRLLASMVVIETRPYYINFVPFGAGQFQNGQPGKAIAFATGQGVTGAVSAGIWLYLTGTYGYNGVVPDEDNQFVRRLEAVEIGTGIACLGLIAWGVVDSLRHYRPSVQRKPDESLLPPELRRKPEPAKPPPRLELAPTASPDGGGLQLRLRF
ncbi:MAG: tetratricopeptide repeat protein [Kofleriaceae bacterium]